MWRSLGLIVAVLLAGCGSADTLPPPAAGAPPVVRAPGGEAVLDTRARTITVGGMRADAGVGPTAIAETEEHVYVTDTVQDALLVFRKEPKLSLQRRAYLPGAPVALEVDEARDRLLVTLDATGEMVAVTLDGAVKALQP
ncbi:MAG: hypothetical protein WKF94_00060 [Solirubrobacteraceae bacterium]